MRDVYIRPNRDLEMPAGHVLKLLRPLYGLADSGDYWNATFAAHLRENLEMKTVRSDMSLFFRHVRGKFAGLIATYVDDTLACVNDTFSKIVSNFEYRVGIGSVI